LIELIIENLPKDKSNFNLNSMLLYLTGLTENYCPEDKYDGYMFEIFDTVYEMLQNETDQNRVSKLQTTLVQYAWSEPSLHILLEWIQGKHENFSHLTLTLEEKWKIISYLSVRNLGQPE